MKHGKQTFRLILLLLILVLAVGWLAFLRLGGRVESAGEPSAEPSQPEGAGPGQPGENPFFITTDLIRFAEEYFKKNPEQTDLLAPVFQQGQTSVHLMALGKNQYLPPHQPRSKTQWMAVIRGDGQAATLSQGGAGTAHRLKPGDLFSRKPVCCSELMNRSGQDPLLLLVLSSPPFAGNLFCRPGTPAVKTPASAPRSLIGLEPSIVSREKPFLVQPVEIDAGFSISRVQVATNREWKTEKIVLLYGLEGEGLIICNRVARSDLGPGKIAVVRAGVDANIFARKEKPLNLLLVQF